MVQVMEHGPGTALSSLLLLQEWEHLKHKGISSFSYQLVCSFPVLYHSHDILYLPPTLTFIDSDPTPVPPSCTILSPVLSGINSVLKMSFRTFYSPGQITLYLLLVKFVFLLVLFSIFPVLTSCPSSNGVPFRVPDPGDTISDSRYLPHLYVRPPFQWFCVPT